MKKRIVIIGAGPGGLAAAMLLASKGYDVTIFEKEKEVGGRNGRLTLGEYFFDIGPTFLMLPHFLAELFTLAGRNMEDYLHITPLDPLYRLAFPDGTDFYPSRDKEKTLAEIERVFPEETDNYLRFLHHEGYRYRRVEKCFKVPYSKASDFFRPSFMEALPQMDVFNTLQTRLKRYFKNEKMAAAMSFQTKYIGMSPWQAPSAYSLISYIEHQWGLHHITGGLNRIPVAMAQVVTELGGKIYTGTPVRCIVSKNRTATGVELQNGEKVDADYVVVNADFAYAMTHLLNKEQKGIYTHANLKRRQYSCSTFMIYLGVKKKYDMPHHNLLLGEDFKKGMDEITMSEQPSTRSLLYIHNPSAMDNSLAPKGCSSLYILAPVPNNKAQVQWNDMKQAYRDSILDLIIKTTPLSDLKEHIEEEAVFTPWDWQTKFHVYNGAVFNLSHALHQMFYFRPHNKSEELDKCYIVGGGTHPGSGLPTIYLSALISSELLLQEDTGKEGPFFNTVHL